MEIAPAAARRRRGAAAKLATAAAAAGGGGPPVGAARRWRAASAMAGLGRGREGRGGAARAGARDEALGAVLGRRLIHLLNRQLPEQVARQLFARFDENQNDTLQLAEFSEMMAHVLGQELKDEVPACTTSLRTRTGSLPDFLEFFRRSDETVRRSLARITAKVGNTVTTVAVSLNQRIARSMDCFARVYDAYREGRRRKLRSRSPRSRSRRAAASSASAASAARSSGGASSTRRPTRRPSSRGRTRATSTASP